MAYFLFFIISINLNWDSSNCNSITPHCWQCQRKNRLNRLQIPKKDFITTGYYPRTRECDSTRQFAVLGSLAFWSVGLAAELYHWGNHWSRTVPLTMLVLMPITAVLVLFFEVIGPYKIKYIWTVKIQISNTLEWINISGFSIVTFSWK